MMQMCKVTLGAGRGNCSSFAWGPFEDGPLAAAPRVEEPFGCAPNGTQLYARVLARRGDDTDPTQLRVTRGDFLVLFFLPKRTRGCSDCQRVVTPADLT